MTIALSSLVPAFNDKREFEPPLVAAISISSSGLANRPLKSHFFILSIILQDNFFASAW